MAVVFEAVACEKASCWLEFISVLSPVALQILAACISGLVRTWGLSVPLRAFGLRLRLRLVRLRLRLVRLRLVRLRLVRLRLVRGCVRSPL